MLLNNCKPNFLLLQIHSVNAVRACDICRSRICLQPSTADGTLFQFILLSILDYGRDSYVSGKGILHLQLLFLVSYLSKLQCYTLYTDIWAFCVCKYVKDFRN